MVNFEINKQYTNRHGETYKLIPDGESYKLDISTPYLRYGGPLTNDLQFVDPSGGPYISVGECSVGGNAITCIRIDSAGIHLDV